MERRCPLAVGRADNAKLHHVLKFSLSIPLRRWIEATIAQEGSWTGRSDMTDNTVWWQFTGSGEVRQIRIFS